jgi:predicted dehydrogenase
VPAGSVALLGLGFAGSQLHLPALQRLHTELALLADPDPSTHRHAGGAPTSTDWREVFASSASAVIVATPPETHAVLVPELLRSGRHVLVEKPMTTSAADAAMILDTEAAAGRVLRVGFAYRFHPLWRRVRRLVEHRRLVPPLRMTARFTGHASDPVLDLSPHHVDLVSWLLGAAPVRAESRTGNDIVVTWADESVLCGSYGRGAPEDRVILDSAQGRIEVDRLNGRRLRCSLGLRAGAPVPGLAVQKALWPTWERSFLSSDRAFLAASLGQSAPLGASARDGARAVRVSEALLRSRVSGGPEPVAER